MRISDADIESHDVSLSEQGRHAKLARLAMQMSHWDEMPHRFDDTVAGQYKVLASGKEVGWRMGKEKSAYSKK